MSEQQRSAAAVEFFGDRLASRRRCGPVNEEGRHACALQVRGQGGLGLEELRENNRSALATRERLEQLAFAPPTPLQRRLLLPVPGGCRIRKFLQRFAPGGRAAPGRLQ